MHESKRQIGCNSLDSEIHIFDKPLPKRNAREREWATLKSTYTGYCEKYSIISEINIYSLNLSKSNSKAINRNWSNQRQIPLLKPKREINRYYKLTKYNKNKLLTERAAISQKVATR